ncbi:membrane protease subunit, stomatin/prohibitin [Desulfosporosinus acidiphilus SJ4]|uniref:Membrane protease subunit, stomatin/prohibitin n=1 Tax=Desulfosporosinus acidiphilus (strain DSM 22704 / JCM 16185 / SJ4) TaxID=646529 RepID=I4D241_DESAJ|nr:slipin family protein [Desulfosporosinus acidiphilus]AFM39865.1 membrane protease subunit, stomatin/prohibitin [Desulfosporosinus acidiphilus SJ4]
MPNPNINLTNFDFRGPSPLSLFLAFIVLLIGGLIWLITGWIGWIVIGAFVAILVGYGVKVANQWEKAVILRLGKFSHLAGPGLFFVIPIIDSVSNWIDHRTITTTFKAEQTLTKDTVPVDVDAVLFWTVVDAKKASLEVAQYRDAVFWAAQTALRDVIGRTNLAEMLSDRERIDRELKEVIDKRTEPWGVNVNAVEIRDVVLPSGLQDAMSREAQAERERRARIILGTAETEIAAKFAEAAKSYENNPVALHLRAMNILYEGIKEKGAMVIVPSSIVETMGLGAVTGLTSLASTVKPPNE